MTEQKPDLPHKLTLDQQKRLTVTGVTEVISFVPDGAVLKTNCGMLLVQGKDLKLKALSQEGGQIEVTGTVTALSYEQPRSRGTLRRLFE